MERRSAPRNPQVESSLRIGVAEIDRDHLALVAQLDRLQGDGTAFPGTEIFSEILSRLGRQINSHFDSEELIMRESPMPRELVEIHIREHTEILEQYSRINLEMMDGQRWSREEALGLIRKWIVEHVLTQDVKIAEYFPGDPALTAAP